MGCVREVDICPASPCRFTPLFFFFFCYLLTTQAFPKGVWPIETHSRGIIDTWLMYRCFLYTDACYVHMLAMMSYSIAEHKLLVDISSLHVRDVDASVAWEVFLHLCKSSRPI